jgi:hypothetical protein
MSTTLSPVRVTEVKISVQDVLDNLGNAIGAIPGLDAADDEWKAFVGLERWNTDPSVAEHPAGTAWDAVEREVLAEVAPEVAKLLREAFAKRLPWTWEPQR